MVIYLVKQIADLTLLWLVRVDVVFPCHSNKKNNNNKNHHLTSSRSKGPTSVYIKLHSIHTFAIFEIVLKRELVFAKYGGDLYGGGRAKEGGERGRGGGRRGEEGGEEVGEGGEKY